MTKQIFTLKDIKEFLLEQGYLEWTMNVIDSKSGEIRKATIEDFDYSGRLSSTTLAFNYHGTTEVKDITITDFQFLSYRYDSNVMGSGETQIVDKDYSQLWCDFLLKKYREKYAKELFDWSINNMSRIEKRKKENIEKFITQENAKYKQSIEHFTSLAEQSMKYLPGETIDNLNL